MPDLPLPVVAFSHVGLSVADLDRSGTVGRIHLAEAISYRISAERMAQAA